VDIPFPGSALLFVNPLGREKHITPLQALIGDTIRMPTTPPADPTEIANTVVNWSALVLTGFTLLLTIFTLIFLAAGFAGIRELVSIRRAGNDARKAVDQQLDEVNDLLRKIHDEVDNIDERLTTLVEVSYLFNQGEAAYRNGDYEKAVEFLSRAAQLEPKNEKLLFRLGRSLTNVGDDIAGPARIKKAQELGMAGGAPERGLALAYRYTQPTQALRYAEQAVERGIDSPRNWNCLGLIRRDRGDVLGARQAHERAAELDYDSSTTPFYLALLEAHHKATQRAVEEANEAVYRLASQERRGQVKPMWAELIRWGHSVIVGNYEEADRFVPLIVHDCKSMRRAREIYGHMDFLLRALDRESMRERYVGPIEAKWPHVTTATGRVTGAV
jgi:tetratricopeptide (TPR) repeat protein